MMINWFGIVQETLMITSFVIVVMLLIEFINVISGGRIISIVNKSKTVQIIAGTLLGLIPGCMGTFTAVSLYTHRVFSFGALLAAMIATTGDEAYFMIAFMPEQTIYLFAILVVLAIAAGFIADKVLKNRNFAESKKFAFELHNHDHVETPGKSFSFKNFSFLPTRMIIVLIIVAVITLAFTGVIGHSHSDSLIFSLPKLNSTEKVQLSEVEPADVHEHDHEADHDVQAEDHSAHSHETGPDWVKITILISSFFALIVVLFSTDHFIKTHLWQHLIKKHLPKILFWVALTLIAISFLLKYAEFGDWIYNNLFIVLCIALLVGVIPQSGPNLVFVILFIQGTIPFSILLANSIVQNGHGPLPLLAESKKSFFIYKSILVVLGLIAGSAGLLFNF